MSTKMKVICPKCKAKLKFDPDKVTSEVIKFKCPGCAAVLKLRKPASRPDKTAVSNRAETRPAGGASLAAGEDLFVY